ncbi:MAG: universal stress protein [Geminicoccaceae bacterium]|nr:universal stress protein [Geminicoccaceae bacterium]
MRYKDFLVVVDGKSSNSKCLDAAIRLAETFEAHLSTLLMVPEPANPVVAGVPMPAEILAEQREQFERSAAETLAAVRERGERAGVSLELRKETAMYELWADRLARQGRHADLTIIAQPDPDDDFASEHTVMIEAAFMQTGRPALVIPYIGPRNLPPERVTVCWDGSREAARAMHDSLPFLENARETTLLIVNPEKLGAAVGELPGADVAAHLARHGINVEIRTIASGELSPGDAILGEASDQGTDLLVMGGYGHSRLREMVLGGVTRRITETMIVPVLLSH